MCGGYVSSTTETEPIVARKIRLGAATKNILRAMARRAKINVVGGLYAGDGKQTFTLGTKKEKITRKQFEALRNNGLIENVGETSFVYDDSSTFAISDAGRNFLAQ